MKLCCTCKMQKALSEFNKAARNKDGLQSSCRSCNKARSARYYAENREKHIAITTEASKETRQEYVARNRWYIFEYLKTHPCVDCGLTDIRVLEFDHIRDKISGVGKLAYEAASLERIKQEIAKCEVRCRNCHTIKTYERLGGTWREQLLLIEET